MTVIGSLLALPAPREGDVVMTVDANGNRQCHVNQEWLSAVRTFYRQKLTTSADTVMSTFPIDRHRLVEDLLRNVFTENAVCAVVDPTIKGNAERGEYNHNTLRRQARGSGVEPDEAKKHGVVTRYLPMTLAACPEGNAEYDWPQSSEYYDVESCHDVRTAASQVNRALGSLYATSLDQSRAEAELADPQNTLYVMDHDDGSPAACENSDGTRGTFFEISLGAFLPDIEFALESFHAPGSRAWNMLTHCGDNTPTDLMYSKGIQAFTEVVVAEAGEHRRMTLILETSATASSSRAKRGAASVFEDAVRRNYAGTIVARKHHLDAVAAGQKGQEGDK